MLVEAGYHATWDWQFKYSGSEMCHNEVTRMHGDDTEEGTKGSHMKIIQLLGSALIVWFWHSLSQKFSVLYDILSENVAQIAW